MRQRDAQIFSNSVYSKTAIGDLLLMHVQASQVESGLPIALLEQQPSVHVSYLTPLWVM